MRISELRTKRETIPGKILETRTLRAFVVLGTGLLGGSVLEFFLRGRHVAPQWFALGAACGIISFYLRRGAIRALGKFWSLHVEIREQHQFINSGPFRWMRHPTYLSMVLELLAGALMLNAFLTLTIVLILFVPILCIRIRIEENALLEKFGDLYRSYQSRTPAIFPYKWPMLR
jgi:protein-S-isoprenylcysteine O-methyltransferase Ste14